MKRTRIIKINGVIYTILICTTADLIVPTALEIACNLEQIQDKQVCAQNVQEPIKTAYNDLYFPAQYVTASGTATVNTPTLPPLDSYKV